MASAAAIQRAMLPGPQNDLAPGRLDIFAHMLPAREVGGDLYDIVKLDASRVFVTIGDVCGKGVPASLFMAMTQTVMRLVVRSGDDMEKEINTANQLLCADNRESMLRKGASAFEPLVNCGPPLGIMEEIAYKPRAITLAPGDLLLLYTDGVTEAEDTKAGQFGTQRLEQALLEVGGHPARAVVERVIARVEEFAKGAPQADDITCVAVVRTELRQTP
jgi:sigma-B regulation protein RsbU (phosphoserine phosphatase)